MRIYVSADIEGVAGVVSRDQGGPGAFEYEPARRWMTAEVTAACEAAFAGGVDEVVVSDSHGNGQNLLLDELPRAVEVVRSWPRPLSMMQGIEHGEFAAAFLIGYHAGSTNTGGVLAHTKSSKAFREVRLNGSVVSEAQISAATAAYFGVPIVLASGDDVFAAEIVESMPWVETVMTKTAYGTLSARSLSPAESCARIREGVSAALAKAESWQLYDVSKPIELQVSFKHRLPAELLEYLSIFRRVDAFTVTTTADDMPGVSQVLSFLTQYSPTRI